MVRIDTVGERGFFKPNGYCPFPQQDRVGERSFNPGVFSICPPKPGIYENSFFTPRYFPQRIWVNQPTVCHVIPSQESRYHVIRSPEDSRFIEVVILVAFAVSLLFLTTLVLI